MSKTQNELAGPQASALSRIVRLFLNMDLDKADFHIINTLTDEELIRRLHRLKHYQFLPSVLVGLWIPSTPIEKTFKELVLAEPVIKGPIRIDLEAIYATKKFITEPMSDFGLGREYRVRPVPFRTFLSLMYLLVHNKALGDCILNCDLRGDLRYVIYTHSGEHKFACEFVWSGSWDCHIYPYTTDRDSIAGAPGNYLLNMNIMD